MSQYIEERKRKKQSLNNTIQDFEHRLEEIEITLKGIYQEIKVMKRVLKEKVVKLT